MKFYLQTLYGCCFMLMVLVIMLSAMLLCLPLVLVCKPFRDRANLYLKAKADNSRAWAKQDACSV